LEYFEKETKYSRTFTKYQTRKSFEEIEAHNRNYEDEEKVRFRVMEKM